MKRPRAQFWIYGAVMLTLGLVAYFWYWPMLRNEARTDFYRYRVEQEGRHHEARARERVYESLTRPKRDTK